MSGNVAISLNRRGAADVSPSESALYFKIEDGLLYYRTSTGDTAWIKLTDTVSGQKCWWGLWGAYG